MRLFKSVPRAVFLLGLVSLFTDASTEMIFPILPLFLTQVLGAGPMAIGIIEGVAETTAATLKVFSGVWADRLKRRKPLVVLGYGLSSFFRPFIGLATVWPVVLVLRFIDRLGKGIRSSPRDALIADITNSSNRGISFGFHQAMDHAGAVLGPLVAYALLSPMVGFSMKTVILLSVVPGAIAWLTLFFGVEEKQRKVAPRTGRLRLGEDWRKFDGSFKYLLFALLVFTLGGSTDAFLLVRLSQLGATTASIPVLWALFHVIKMVAAAFGGKLSDRFGRKPIIFTGWAYYALIYGLFALIDQKGTFIAVFLAYGVFYGLSEPVEKAFVADLAPPALRGTAFGYYNLMVGLAALPASLIFGFLGQSAGYPWAFTVGALFAGAASLLLLAVKAPRRPARA